MNIVTSKTVCRVSLSSNTSVSALSSGTLVASSTCSPSTAGAGLYLVRFSTLLGVPNNSYNSADFALKGRYCTDDRLRLRSVLLVPEQIANIDECIGNTAQYINMPAIHNIRYINI